MIRLAIFGNDRQTAGFENLATLFSQFGTYSPMLDISVETDYLKFLTSTAGIANLKARPFDKGNFHADLVLSIGGHIPYNRQDRRCGTDTDYGH